MKIIRGFFPWKYDKIQYEKFHFEIVCVTAEFWIIQGKKMAISCNELNDTKIT